MAIHPTAVIDPRARLHPDVEVGPFAVIDGGVELGPGCRVGPHAHLTGHTTAGARNVFGTGCVIGGEPQDLRFKGAPTRLRIGDDNTFREYVTVHCANGLEEDTEIGSGCYIMAGAHVGHNARIGNHVIIANGAQIAGHVQVADRAFISAYCLLHQFVRVGTLAMMRGGAGISKDLPPYCIARGVNSVCGLNVVGLRRAGIDPESRLELRRLYRIVFRSGKLLKEALEEAGREARGPWGRHFVEFVRESRRGVLRERRAGDAEADDEAD